MVTMTKCYLHRGFQIQHICDHKGRRSGQLEEVHAIHYSSQHIPATIILGPYKKEAEAIKAIDRFADGFDKFVAVNGKPRKGSEAYKLLLKRYMQLCMNMDDNIRYKKVNQAYGHGDPTGKQREHRRSK